MKNSVKIFGSTLLIALLFSCGASSSKLDELMQKKKVLKTQLAEIQMQINALNDGKEENLLPIVTLSDIQTTTFIHKIKVQGTVETDQDVLLNAEFGGLITQVHVKEGQYVSVGQVLVSLDAAMLSSNMQELETQLEYANYMLEKQEELKKRGVGSEFDYKATKNQVDGLRSKMKSLSTQRGKSSIKAPFSGFIDKIYAKNGQIAGPQSPLMRLVNNSEINISADISEKHLENVKIGTEVVVRFPNYKDTSVTLKITHIGNYIDPTNRTFRVMANMKNNKLFLPNMLAELEITDVHAPNSIVIPSKSILKSQKNEDFIYIAKKDNKGLKTKQVFVDLIEKYDGNAHIEFKDYAFKKSDKVVVDGARGIDNNMFVKQIK
jgi:membrane fusion protein, multidrug efflux system